MTPLTPLSGTVGTGAAAGAGATSGSGFGSQIANAVNSLQQSQATAATDEAQMAAGGGNLADTMVAASQASLETQVTNDVLTKAITAYNSVLNMSF
ncbi:MAG TPA: flagellar hook-basal body complex protein FliE [Acidimicrobiales bacterium]|jgi:flagellar hook-basal body complex protein FliE|nr:flagellar hook-basal body complex protein FliE [Acidimicrobiales bacterium]